MTTVLVTPRSMTERPPEALSRLEALGATIVFGPAGRQPSRPELAELLPFATAWIAGVEPIDADVLAAAPDLRLIARNGVGSDSIDRIATDAAGIRVTTTPGANAGGVAELAVLAMLAALRGHRRAADALSQGRWSRTLGRELGASRVGVVGLGAIGYRVAELASAFGADVAGTEPFPRPGVAERYPLLSLHDLLVRSDVLTLHTPGSSDGTALLDDAAIRSLPAGAVVVNTARWGLVDADAMRAALDDGHVAAYAVDAFAAEPPTPHPLLEHPAVDATPHIGAFTAESATRAAEAAIEQVAAFLTESIHDVPPIR